MTLISYSQCGEDLLLLGLFHADGVKIKRGGMYVDVAAHHPKRFSNTQLFYENGWSGINFEPNEEVKTIFNKIRTRDKTIFKALSSSCGKMKFHTYDETALNSLVNRDKELTHTPYKSCEKKLVQVSTLELELGKHSFEKISKPTFLDIDVEGLELKVLKGNDWNKYNFSYILIEIKEKDLYSKNNNKVSKYLRDINYVPVACSQLTTIFKRIIV